MKKRLIWFLILLTSVSCNNKNEVTMDNADFVIGINRYQVNDPISANENCGHFFIQLIPTNQFPYFLDLTLSRKGDLIKAILVDKTKNYESQVFNPTKSFAVNSFRFDSLAHSLSLQVEGTLFKPYSTESITLKGAFKHIQLSYTSCASILSTIEAELEAESGGKERLYASRATAESNSTFFRQYFYTNNGYRIVLESKPGIETMLPGLYTITSESTPVNVTFEKYLGLSDQNNFYIYDPKEWQSFRTDGKLEIGQVVSVNGSKGVAGKLTLTAYTGNQAVYQLKNGIFTVSLPGL